MHIYIPTMRRVALQHTHSVLLQSGTRYPVTLVCPYDEWDAYHSAGYRHVISPPPEIVGIAATRQWIMDYDQNHSGAVDDHIVMMDDDLTFYCRRLDDLTKFRSATHEDIQNMLIILHAELQHCAHASIACREGGNRNTQPYLWATRATRVLGFQRSVFLARGVDFRHSLVQDDFEATLALLTQGYGNRVLNMFVQNQVGSGTKGGASTYRTMEMHAKSCHMLQARYPDFVRLVQKKTKTAWGGTERTDVIIQWKKALDYGLKQRALDELAEQAQELGKTEFEAL